jgi:hypothetical protein
LTVLRRSCAQSPVGICSGLSRRANVPRPSRENQEEMAAFPYYEPAPKGDLDRTTPSAGAGIRPDG